MGDEFLEEEKEGQGCDREFYEGEFEHLCLYDFPSGWLLLRFNRLGCSRTAWYRLGTFVTGIRELYIMDSYIY